MVEEVCTAVKAPVQKHVEVCDISVEGLAEALPGAARLPSTASEAGIMAYKGT